MADLPTGREAPNPPGAATSRRKFLTWLSRAFLGLWAVGGVGVVTTYMGGSAHDEGGGKVVRVGALDSLRIGEIRLIRHDITPFFVIRTSESSVVALSAICTHERCVLNVDREHRTIVCPCHNCRFDLNGKILSGPPPRALPSYEVSVRAGEVFVRI